MHSRGAQRMLASCYAGSTACALCSLLTWGYSRARCGSSRVGGVGGVGLRWRVGQTLVAEPWSVSVGALCLVQWPAGVSHLLWGVAGWLCCTQRMDRRREISSGGGLHCAARRDLRCMGGCGVQARAPQSTRWCAHSPRAGVFCDVGVPTLAELVSGCVCPACGPWSCTAVAGVDSLRRPSRANTTAGSILWGTPLGSRLSITQHRSIHNTSAVAPMQTKLDTAVRATCPCVCVWVCVVCRCVLFPHGRTRIAALCNTCISSACGLWCPLPCSADAAWLWYSLVQGSSCAAKHEVCSSLQCDVAACTSWLQYGGPPSHRVRAADR